MKNDKMPLVLQEKEIYVFFILFKRHKSHKAIYQTKKIKCHWCCNMPLAVWHCCVAQTHQRISGLYNRKACRCAGKSISVNQLILARVTYILAIGGLCVGVSLGK